LIYDILREIYYEAAGRQLLTGMVVAHQTFSGLQSMVEVFRRRVIKLLLERVLLNRDFARNLLSWKHSGFSIDNSVRIIDKSSQESLAEYIARPPMTSSSVRPFGRRVSVSRHKRFRSSLDLSYPSVNALT
jgi:zona occludens toxin (predicted ATPase)